MTRALSSSQTDRAAGVLDDTVTILPAADPDPRFRTAFTRLTSEAGTGEP